MKQAGLPRGLVSVIAHSGDSAVVLPILGLAWSAAVGLSRVALGVHWPSDIAAGWIPGLVAGLASGLLLV